MAEYVDIAQLYRDGLTEPEPPTVCLRDDGHGLFYRGAVNVLFGDSETGKTWLALAAGVEAMHSGLGFLMCDLDHNGPATIISRLEMLGADETMLSNRSLFRLAEPEDRDDMLSVVADAGFWNPAVAVVDSMGELLVLHGANSNNPDDYTRVHREVLTALSGCGACVIAIDHVAKNTESNQYGATGTAAKKRAVNGAQIRVVGAEPFAPGKGGASHLYVTKDRNGGLRAVAKREPGERQEYVGTFTLSEFGCEVKAPRPDERAPHSWSERDVQRLVEMDTFPANLGDAAKALGIRKADAGEAYKEAKRRRGLVPGSHSGVGNRNQHNTPDGSGSGNQAGTGTSASEGIGSGSAPLCGNREPADTARSSIVQAAFHRAGGDESVALAGVDA
ncbi:AAA family ATPase [Pseudoclavibacter alba]|uniref:AAA family ATPase n=1 Tax=Pseudoclavibacter albus TaxID=272241 RepID=A0ABT2HUE3_9MICO|nr:AAA family ATPase [Pseudoclavibacter alba]MCT2041929.1 AAA family ATPase [Pseudoclavibacter alba]